MPEFIENKSDYSFLLHLNIKPNSKRQKLIDEGEYLTVLLKSKPTQNRANKELITLLKKKLKISSNQIEFISGLKRKNKLLQINFSKKIDTQDIIQRLLNG